MRRLGLRALARGADAVIFLVTNHFGEHQHSGGLPISLGSGIIIARNHHIKNRYVRLLHPGLGWGLTDKAGEASVRTRACFRDLGLPVEVIK